MSGNKKELLVIAYVFPPIAYAGTFRSLRLCKYLTRLGFSLSVLTIEEQPDLHNDQALLEQIQDKVKIHRTRTVDPWRWYQPKKKHLVGNLPGRMLDKAISLLLDFVNQPDHMIFWVPFAVVKGLSLCRGHKDLVLYTSSPPHSEHWIGYLLKKFGNKKWIADLRDPIIGNIGTKKSSHFHKAILAFLERRVLGNADAVIVNTAVAKKHLETRFPGRNIHHVGNSYDPEDFSGISEEKFPAFTLAHIGSLYSFRKIDGILQAIRSLHDQGHITPENFQLLLVGLNNKRVAKEVGNSGVERFVSIRPAVSHRNALEIMVRSHLLLLIKGFGPNSATQIPGKLFEYLGSGNPILYLGPEESEAADIIRSQSAGYIIAGKTAEIESSLLESVTKFRRNPGTPEPEGRNKLASYSSLFMARKIGTIIDAL
jgi:hypothetical protein